MNFEGRGQTMSCSLSQTTSADIGGNATDAEGGNSDAEKACESGVRESGGGA